MSNYFHSTPDAFQDERDEARVLADKIESVETGRGFTGAILDSDWRQCDEWRRELRALGATIPGWRWPSRLRPCAGVTS